MEGCDGEIFDQGVCIAGVNFLNFQQIFKTLF